MSLPRSAPGRPPRAPQLPFLRFLLLALAATSWPSPGAAVARPDPHASRALRAGFERLLSELRANLSREDSNPDLAVRVLTPELHPGPGGRLLLRTPLPPLTQGLPASYRLHRALLQLSPSTPQPWDITRPLRRELGRRGPRGAALRVRLTPPAAQAQTGPPSAGARLELHFRPPAARGRRSADAQARDACPLGPGRCCHLQTVPATLQDLGWGDWVLSPRQLQVSLCVGECPQQYRAASTHAQVKARLHGLRPHRVPAPCCVPSAYAPVVLLHRADGGLALRAHDDLMARGCHCA